MNKHTMCDYEARLSLGRTIQRFGDIALTYNQPSWKIFELEKAHRDHWNGSTMPTAISGAKRVTARRGACAPDF